MQQDDELRRENQALRERLSALSQASLRINQSLDFPAVLQGVLDSARSLTGASVGVMTLLDGGGQVQHFLSSGLTPAQAEGLWLTPDGQRVLEALSGLPEPLRIPDVVAYVRALGFTGFSIPVPVGRACTFMASPILHQDTRVGHIFVGDKDGGKEFTLEDQETLVMFAAQAALVIANAGAHREEQRARSDLETLVNTSPVGVVVFDGRTGEMASVNREALRIVDGLRDADRPAEDLLEVVTCVRSDGREYSLRDFTLVELLNAGETVRAEEIALRVPDGRSVSVLVNATPMRSGDGQLQSFVVTLQDLTPLEEQERLRADFLGMVSHELRAPLASIKGSAATVLGGGGGFGPAEMVQFFHIIDQQADQMSGLVSDLLDVARIETGALSVAPEPALLGALVEQARSAFAGRGGQHGVRVDLPPDLPRVMADPRRIVQVLGNLLANAARHSPVASPIRVSAVVEEFQVSVTVADQGSGVSAEGLPLLFRKFSRVGSEGQGGDTGLGLAISKGIVEAHGGRIWAESDGLGRGSRFTFTLAVAEDAAAGGGRRGQPTGRQPAERERVRVLAVDDDPQALRLVRDALAGAGYAPLVSADPREALRLAEAEDPDLALLDLMLPDTDGIQLMQDIQAVSGAPVIFLSAYGQEDVVARAFDLGAADYVVKPFAPTELAARIRAALRRRAAAEEAGTAEPYVRGDLVIDYARRSVTLAGRSLRLTAIEYRLLAELAANAGQTLDYQRLLERVWGQPQQTDLRPMRTAVRGLRRKLGEDADNPVYIFTEPRVGYRMAVGETGKEEAE